MDATLELVCRFTAALERLLTVADAERFEAAWEETGIQPLAWNALTGARQSASPALERALRQLDTRLLATLERSRAFPDPHIATFRVTELERWQHATAAALVNARWGVAGLRTVIADTRAPLGRRYFAFLTLAQGHPPEAWPLFEKYLRTPEAHHAFVAAAVDASAHYGHPAVDALVGLFDRIRGDQMLRRFLAPRILEALYQLNDPAAEPLYLDLAVAGHTDADPEVCEVTRALVGLRRLTGRVAESAKYPDASRPEVREALDHAERLFADGRAVIPPVNVI
jgi:hypothetical protein